MSDNITDSRFNEYFGFTQEEDYDQIFGYGIAFFKKRCLLKKTEQK